MLIMTRGTRGDVQPYIALALGLIKLQNCEVTLVTEINWKPLIHDWRKCLPENLQDRLHFRPSGGDTMQQMNSDLAAFVLRVGHQMDLVQAVALSKTEQSFFSSEGCFFHWAAEERPDYIVFGFTVLQVAMLISEVLRLPLVGMFLQPAHEISPPPDSDAVIHQLSGPFREMIGSARFNAYAKQIMEKIPEGGYTLNKLRVSRGLNPCPSGIRDQILQYTELRHQDIKQIVPINPVVLGEHRAASMRNDHGVTLTDFIFLRREDTSLDERVERFISAARMSERLVVAMTMSSMPVGERQILEVAVAVCTKCDPILVESGAQHRPAFIACIGGQAKDAPASEGLLEEVRRLESEGRLLRVYKSIDFGKLFPKLDAVILHGGLGVTAEALVAGIPIIVSGILLLDQRFWAACVSEQGCGPQGTFIHKLLEEQEDGRPCVVRLIEQALKDETLGGTRMLLHPDATAKWRKAARELKAAIEQGRAPNDVEDGLSLNARTVHEAGLEGRIITYSYARYRNPCRNALDQAFCFGRMLHCCVKCLICRQLRILVVMHCRCLRWCLCLMCRCRRRPREEDLRMPLHAPPLHSVISRPG